MKRKRPLILIFSVITFALIIAIILVYVLVQSNQQQVENIENVETNEFSEDSDEKTYFMFIQNATSGTMKPIDGTDDKYLLTLNNISPSTIYFSDRPERVSGQASMQDFLDGLGFSESNPPNAAIEVLKADNTSDVLVVELFSPIYDETAMILTYEVTILKDEVTGGLAHYNDKKSVNIIESFENVALFIDDCPDLVCSCYHKNKVVGDVKTGGCWSWYHFTCTRCGDTATGVVKKCNKEVSKCKGKCDDFSCDSKW